MSENQSGRTSSYHRDRRGCVKTQNTVHLLSAKSRQVQFRPRLLLVLVYSLFLPCSVFSGDSNERQDDLVAFFKASISSSPDVEYFSANEKDLQASKYGMSQEMFEKLTPHAKELVKASKVVPVRLYEGARSGENYYLRTIVEGGSFVEVRSGSNLASVGLNSLTYWDEKTPNIEKSFMVSRILNAGVVELRPGSVIWNGNKFTGTDKNGFLLYGSLLTSNNIPVRLIITEDVEGIKPKSSIEYKYPAPAFAFGGFPETMVISWSKNGMLVPTFEVSIKEVRLAANRLPPSFFDVSKFINTNIQHTNIYINNEEYAVGTSGKKVKLISKPPPEKRR